MSDLETRLDVGNQRPIKWTKDGALSQLESWLTRCWCCREDEAVDRTDTLGLCERCIQQMQGGS